jgi:RNA polymerase sigma factor (sigma-70 family)
MNGSARGPAEAKHITDAVDHGYDSPALSFEDFFRSQGESLYRALCLVSGSASEAEECVQEAFALVWERWDRVRTMDRPGGYLHEVAMNVMRRRWRRASLVRRLSAPDPRDEFAAADAHRTVEQGLASLTPRQRAALVLTEILGYDTTAAARLMKIAPSTVRALASQGRTAMRASLEGQQHE